MKVTPEDIKNINELYLKYKTYAEVGRQTGYSPATVKKYIQKDFAETQKVEIKRFEGKLPDFNPEPFRVDDWGKFCEMTEDEILEVRELWKELVM